MMTYQNSYARLYGTVHVSEHLAGNALCGAQVFHWRMLHESASLQLSALRSLVGDVCTPCYKALCEREQDEAEQRRSRKTWCRDLEEELDSHLKLAGGPVDDPDFEVKGSPPEQSRRELDKLKACVRRFADISGADPGVPPTGEIYVNKDRYKDEDAMNGEKNTEHCGPGKSLTMKEALKQVAGHRPELGRVECVQETEASTMLPTLCIYRTSNGWFVTDQGSFPGDLLESWCFNDAADAHELVLTRMQAIERDQES